MDEHDETRRIDRGSRPNGTADLAATRGDDGWIESSVPRGADTADCPYCGRPFTRERHRDLHRGRAHPDRLTDHEVEAYREAAEAEWNSLKRFRLLALGALVVVYFGFLIAFAVYA